MKTTLPTLLLAATLCASALVMPQARAQFDVNPFPGYDMATLGNMATMDGIAQDIRRQESDRQRDARPSAPPRGQGARKTKPRQTTPKKAPLKKAPTAAAPVVMTYRESPAVKQRMQARFIALFTKGQSPEGAARMKRDMAQQDFVAMWAGDATPNGLKRGDVSDAMASYLVDSWLIVNEVESAGAAQFQGVRRQVAGRVRLNEGFAKMSNEARQETAEGFIYAQLTQRLLGAFAQKRGDEAAEASRDAIAARFKKSLGLDLRTLKLTNAGFAPK